MSALRLLLLPLTEPVALPETVIQSGGEFENAWTYRTPRSSAAESTRRCVASASQSQWPAVGWYLDGPPHTDCVSGITITNLFTYHYHR